MSSEKRVGGLLLREESGQATTEYAVVLAAFMAMLAVVGAIWHAARDGALLRLSEQSSAYAVEGGGLGGWQDILAF